MGVIRSQSLKFSSVNLVGTIIGGFSMLYIYSLDDKLYGFAQMLVSMAYLIIPFASFGISSVAIRFYREFKNQSDNNGFFSLLLSITLLTNVFFLILYFLFKHSFYQFVEYLEMDSQKLQDNEMIIMFLVVLINLCSLITAYTSNYRKIVVPTLVQQFGYKIYLPIIFLLAYYGVVNIQIFSFLIPIFYSATLVILLLYLRKVGGFNLSWNPAYYKTKMKSIKSYFLFSSLTSLGSSLTFRLDSVMIPLLLGYAPNGLYNKIYFMSNVIGIPTNSINQIANPIISESIKDNKLDEVESIYKKSSTNLFLLGSYVYLGMLFCLPSVFELSINPIAFEGGAMLFAVLGAGKLIDMLTSVNSAIISYSKYYRWNLGFILFLGLSNLFLNYFLINEYQVLGAAMATVIALVLFNILKLIFIYWKFKMHPFSFATIKIIVLFTLIFAIMKGVDFQSNPFLEIIVNGLIISIFAIPIAYYWRISDDANVLLDEALVRFKIKK